MTTICGDVYLGGAGIGGAAFGSGGLVTVNGGTVVAVGSQNGKDIGAGWAVSDNDGALTITGGSVNRVQGTGATPKNSGDATAYCVMVGGLEGLVS